MSAEIFTHTFHPFPVYQLFVYNRPSRGGKGKDAYVNAVKAEASKRIDAIITTSDIELSVLYSSDRPALVRSDIDNILKPTLDALCGLAYNDDRQVRAVSARLLDRGNPNILFFEKFGEALFNSLFHSGAGDVVVIHLYAESRLRTIGQDAVEQRITAEALAETERIFQARRREASGVRI